MTSAPIGRRAVVVGAGMAGLPAAGACADFFEQVVVLERDRLPPDAAPRAGTPQARHTHALLVGGQEALCDLFPGFEQDLVAAGAVPLKVGLDLRLERPGFDPFPQRDLGFVGYALSRPLIELTPRRRVGQCTNITVREHCRAAELVASPAGDASAIRFENGDGRRETLAADLVVEASGRCNLTFGLLQALGRSPPEETAIGVDIGYATAVFAIPEDPPAGWRAVMTFDSAPRGGRAGILFPLERNRWIVTLVGHHADKPPADRDGFLAYAQRLRTSTIFDAIKGAEQLGEMARFGFPASLLRHFERLGAFPRRLLPIGDAICRFNPVWGQGMSVAAQEARLLRDLLRRRAAAPDPLAELAPAFLAEAAALIETPWAMAAVPDLAHPETVGERPRDLEQRLAFGEALNRLAAQDAAVHKLVSEVLHLLKPQSVLHDPALVERARALAAQAQHSR
jgi:2-polyprenyl-6-methoxyphenol hydroxylase-like FAD-dependent oxidoreductase